MIFFFMINRIHGFFKRAYIRSWYCLLIFIDINFFFLFLKLLTHFIYSLTDVPSVSQSEIASHFQQLQEEADEYDMIHDVILKVRIHNLIMAHCQTHFIYISIKYGGASKIN